MPKTLWNFCARCSRDTNHAVQCVHQEEGDPSTYHYAEQYFIVKCKGCNYVSFLKIYHDYENAYPDENNGWVVPKDIDRFPKGKKGALDTWNMPEIVASIYSETCDAYRDGALTLAGIGFRATIEAICNDQNISGKELSVKINNLAAKGLISKKDSARLHSIRFMGNDAAHDIKKPSISSLDAALVIVEHLITTVYILDVASQGALEAVIDDYVRFEELLDKKLNEYSVGDEFPLAQFLGKDLRLVSGSVKQLEKELNARIGKGDYVRLAFGKQDFYMGSKEKLLHYIVR